MSEVWSERDLASLSIPRIGGVVETGDPLEPFRLVDAAGDPVACVASFLRELLASSRSPSTLRSYAMDLLRWLRFLSAVQVGWDAATPVEGRDFSLWIRKAHKSRARAGMSGEVNPVTGKPSPSAGYAPRTVKHSETVLRTFYDFHLDTGRGPMVNPFPRDRSARGRPNAHHDPMQPWQRTREGRYRVAIPSAAPRAIPDGMFELLFAELPSDRDRALVAFWISTGARAAELLGARQRDADPGQQLISVTRKGSRAVQALPASPDAFVWLRLYQQQLHGRVPLGRGDPLWWTSRSPLVALSYHGAHRMFERANAKLGANWTLHDLRHSAAHRMARDPGLPLADVQWILGHAQLTTTQIYLQPTVEEAVRELRAHHARQARGAALPVQPAAGYDRRSMDVLFGNQW